MRIFLGAFLIILLFPVSSASARLVDRVMAVVNGKIVSLSDVETYQTFFWKGHETSEDKKTMEESLLREVIDQRLLLEEAVKFNVEKPTEGEVKAAIEEIEKRLLRKQGLLAALKERGLTRDDLKAEVRKQVRVQKFLDQRIGLFLFLREEEVVKYYEDNAQTFGKKKFDEVRKDIEETLKERKFKEKLEEYLSRLHANATIRINPPP